MNREAESYNGEVHINEGIYPLNWDSNSPQTNIPNSTHSPIVNTEDEKDIYPDFSIWNQTEEEAVIMNSCLQKGYMEPPFVKHEDQSGRPLIADLVNKAIPETSPTLHPKHNKLDLMGQLFVDAMHKRRIFNGIRSRAPYKPPPRVTLTEQKKEIWLKRIADPKIPLRELSRAIPHGLRNKILLEQCLSHEVPIFRAVWLIKCVASNEQRQLKRKNAFSTNIGKWIIEWTEQVTSFFETNILNCFNNVLPKETWRFRLSYTIELVTNLYSADLLNRLSLLTWIVKFTSQIVNKAVTFEDLRPLLLHYNVIKLFWFKILKFDYLTKELAVSMLLILAKLNQLGKSTKFESISYKLSTSFEYLIKYLFYYNSDIFILPSNWNSLKLWLKKTLDLNLPPVSDQFKLIAYRNETLTVDEFDISTSQVPTLSQSPSPTPTPAGIVSHQKLSSLRDRANVNKPKDKISVIFSRLNNQDTETLSSLSKCIFDESNSNELKDHLHLIFQWSIEKVRSPKIIYERIILICSILQYKLSQLINQKFVKYKQFCTDLENTICDFVYKMSELLNYKNSINQQGEFYDVNNFLYLINRLHAINLFVISSYLRRLIASGVIYLADPERTCYIHILILNSLPSSNDSNMKSIFRRLVHSTNIQIENPNIEPFRQKKIMLLDFVFKDTGLSDTEFESSFIDNKFYTDPLYIGEYMQLEQFLFSNYEKKLGTLQNSLFITYEKLMILYQMFRNYPDGLCKLILSIIDCLNRDVPPIIIADSKTFVVFVKILFFNRNYLKGSIYNLKLSMWDHCCEILNSWTEVNRYEINSVIGLTYIPATNLMFLKNYHAELVNIIPNYLTPEELIGLDISSYDRLNNGAEFIQYATLALTRYSTCVRNNDFTQLQLITQFLKSLQVWKPDDFSKCLFDYLNRFYKFTFQLEYESNLNLIIKMLSDGFLDFRKIIDIFGNRNQAKSDILGSENHLYLLWDLLFNDYKNLRFDTFFHVSFAKHIYILNYPEEYTKILSEIIFSCFKKRDSIKEETVSVVGSVDVVNDDPSVNVIHSFPDLDAVSNLTETTRDELSRDFGGMKDIILNANVIDAFWGLVLQHLDLFVEYFYISYEEFSKLDRISLRKFIFQKVFNQFTNINDIDEVEVLKNLNFFNLRVSQWLFIYIIKEQYRDTIDNEAVIGPLVLLIEKMLNILNKDENILTLGGELFVYLPEKFKYKILSACEHIYLNSESFPKVIVGGNNVTNVLSCIISNCSKMNDSHYDIDIIVDEDTELDIFDKKPNFEMSDAIVFSLNGGLEHLIHICNQLDQDKKRLGNNKVHITKDLELGVKMISRIILLHRYFLVQLIIKRSVNLQRDVLILNLLKLFNHKIMMKDPKLKNLLYDVLMSLKLIISEHITERFKRTQASSVSGNLVGNLNLLNKENSTSSTFLSPIDSPMGMPIEEEKKKNKSKVNSNYIIMPNILNIKPPSFNSNLKSLLDMFELKDTIPEVNDNKLYLVNEKWDNTVSDDEPLIKFTSRPFEQIEDSCPSHAVNDTAIGVQLFRMNVKRENPP